MLAMCQLFLEGADGRILPGAILARGAAAGLFFRPPWSCAMTKESFERHYATLSDKADAVEVFGESIVPGVATVGDIRRKLERHTKAAIVYPESDGSGFCGTEVKPKEDVRWRVPRRSNRIFTGIAAPRNESAPLDDHRKGIGDIHIVVNNEYGGSWDEVTKSCRGMSIPVWF
jgi:hypothetical protein